MDEEKPAEPGIVKQPPPPPPGRPPKRPLPKSSSRGSRMGIVPGTATAQSIHAFAAEFQLRKWMLLFLLSKMGTLEASSAASEAGVGTPWADAIMPLTVGFFATCLLDFLIGYWAPRVPTTYANNGERASVLTLAPEAKKETFSPRSILLVALRSAALDTGDTMFPVVASVLNNQVLTGKDLSDSTAHAIRFGMLVIASATSGFIISQIQKRLTEARDGRYRCTVNALFLAIELYANAPLQEKLGEAASITVSVLIKFVLGAVAFALFLKSGYFEAAAAAAEEAKRERAPLVPAGSAVYSRLSSTASASREEPPAEAPAPGRFAFVWTAWSAFSSACFGPCLRTRRSTDNSTTTPLTAEEP